MSLRIVQLTPGAGDSFYCENCLRDSGMVKALRRAGHDVTMVPLYLPPLADAPGETLEATEVFFGGVNVYLQQHSRLFRNTPRWIDRLFDSPRLLKWASRKAGMTSARDLAETTLSMLRGEDGRQVKELDRLVEFLVENERPDVVVLSNALLAGLARRTAEALGCSIVCWLQDEDGFLDSLPEPLRSEAWATVAQRAEGIDAFVATSRYYADAMAGRLGLPADKLHVVSDGLDLAGYAPAAEPRAVPTIGFLSRACAGKGLDTLVAAFLKLRGEFPNLRLRVSGGKTSQDDAFLAELAGRIAAAGASGAVEFVDAFDRDARVRFLQSLTVLSVPTRGPEAFGRYVIESLACGVPVVLPEHGSFPELVAATEGGVLCRPNDAEALAETLAGVLRDPKAAREMGERGRRAVAEQFTADAITQRFLDVCQNALKRQAGRNADEHR